MNRLAANFPELHARFSHEWSMTTSDRPASRMGPAMTEKSGLRC